MERLPERYPKCSKILKPEFIIEVDEGTAKAIGASYDLLPLFENGMFEYAFKKHNSLTTNTKLKCQWDEYKKKKAENPKPRLPMQMPDFKNALHFYNGTIRFYPAASIKYHDHRMKLKPGPGVDHIGQKPIPQEALMKRGTAVITVKKDKRSETSGNTKEKEESRKNP